jgi:serine phosphatase RsbU (regulator of sigma subunit)
MTGRILSGRATAFSARAAWKPATLAVAMGFVAFGVGTVAESLIIRAVDGDRAKLEWLSDVLISTALAAITYLWLHLRTVRGDLVALAREGAAIDEQLRLAAEIQRDLLPVVPEATPGFRWAARMVPAGRIGGDFYDLLVTREGALAIVADVSGKGIPAALILSSLKALFRTTARETGDPATIAERISATLYEEHGGLPYATAIVARFEGARGRLAYVNAGHPAGYLVRDGNAAALLPSTGRPLGLLPGASYTTTNLELAPSDLGILVTDGITEALEAGPLTLGQLLATSSGRLATRPSPAQICDDLLEAAAKGAGPVGVSGFQDDRTVFVFAYEPPA